MEPNVPKWIDRIYRILPQYWQYHQPCKTLDMGCFFDENTGIWNLKVAPVFQEVVGGECDGRKVWSGFVFNIGNFGKAEGVWIQEQIAFSSCNECNPTPKMLVLGKYRGHRFNLHVFMEPLADGPLRENINAHNSEVTPIQEQELESESESESEEKGSEGA